MPFRFEALIRVDGFVGDQYLAALAVPDHGLDRIEQYLRRNFGVAELTCAF